MAEYIDRNAFLKHMKRTGRYFDVKFDIENFPAADVAPVVHGRFVHDGPRFAGGVDWWHCGNCGILASGVETRFGYCPWCGARLDGDSDALD